jgi:class 3 adenylate cyclase
MLAEGDDAAPEDLERLGEAAWWSARPSESIEAFERAYAAHLAAGHERTAALVALRLAMEHADRLETALWNAWVQRAIRLIGDAPDCVERGWLELALVRTSLEHGDAEGAKQHAIAVRDIGVRFGDQDLQAFGLVLQGAVLVYQAEVESGISMLDEGTLAAVGGELSPFAAGNIYCITIGVCRDLADYRRAGEWTEAANRWCERQSITGFPGICSVQRAEILRMSGALLEAETEASKAQALLERFGRLPQAGAGAEQVGEARLRMGDLDGAAEAFELAHRLGHEPQPGLALLRLAQGQLESARASIGAALADAEDPLERARLLPARVEIAISAHELGVAREAADELLTVATMFDAPMLHAAARQAIGAVLAAEEKPTAAITELRAAVRDWIDADMPFEAAHARCALATAYRAGGNESSATLELRAALATFERIGARREAERCEQLISSGQEHGSGRRLERAFMFTDIVGSTSLVESMGDEAWENVLRWHDEVLRELIEEHDGEVVHTTGDGFFAAFVEIDAAAACAISIQRRLAEHRRKHGFAPRVRIGLHAAEATVIPNDYAGVGVHEAARVGALADGDEILVTVSSVAVGTTFVVTNEREVSLKGLATPVLIATIEWRG